MTCSLGTLTETSVLRYCAVLSLLAVSFLPHPIHYDFHIPRSHETLSGKQSCNWRPLLHNNLTTSRSRSGQCLPCLSQLLFSSTCFRPLSHNISFNVDLPVLLEHLYSSRPSPLALSIYAFFAVTRRPRRPRSSLVAPSYCFMTDLLRQPYARRPRALNRRVKTCFFAV